MGRRTKSVAKEYQELCAALGFRMNDDPHYEYFKRFLKYGHTHDMRYCPICLWEEEHGPVLLGTDTEGRE